MGRPACILEFCSVWVLYHLELVVVGTPSVGFTFQRDDLKVRPEQSGSRSTASVLSIDQCQVASEHICNVFMGLALHHHVLDNL